jgi:hypothetical protein
VPQDVYSGERLLEDTARLLRQAEEDGPLDVLDTSQGRRIDVVNDASPPRPAAAAAAEAAAAASPDPGQPNRLLQFFATVRKAPSCL